MASPRLQTKLLPRLVRRLMLLAFLGPLGLTACRSPDPGLHRWGGEALPDGEIRLKLTYPNSPQTQPFAVTLPGGWQDLSRVPTSSGYWSVEEAQLARPEPESFAEAL